MKGAYSLIIKVEEDIDVQIHSLGRISFQTGTWVYVGSAMGNGSTSLENRIARHFRKQKTIYWHIDHLLSKDVELLKAFWAQSPVHSECNIAQEIQARNEFQSGPKQFGSSDCQRGCQAHIFRFRNSGLVDDIIRDVFDSVGLQPSITIDGIL